MIWCAITAIGTQLSWGLIVAFLDASTTPDDVAVINSCYPPALILDHTRAAPNGVVYGAERFAPNPTPLQVDLCQAAGKSVFEISGCGECPNGRRSALACDDEALLVLGNGDLAAVQMGSDARRKVSGSRATAWGQMRSAVGVWLAYVGALAVRAPKTHRAPHQRTSGSQTDQRGLSEVSGLFVEHQSYHRAVR